MRKDLKIDLKGRGERATVAFSVSYRGRDAQKVALVANTIANAYIDENLAQRKRQAGGTAEFLLNQRDELSRKLQELERKVGEFKQRHIGELPEQLDANLKTLQQLGTQLSVNSENMTRATERRANLERELAALLGTSAPTGPDALAQHLAQLKAQLAAMEARFSDKHPDVVRIRNEIANLERPGEGGSGDAARPSGGLFLSPQAQQLKSALSEVNVQLKGLDAPLAAARIRVT